MKKSAVLTAVPAGVATVMRPDVPPAGAVALSAVGDAPWTGASDVLKNTLFVALSGAKSAPAIAVSVAPAVPTVGVNPVMRGATSDVTTNAVLLDADPPGLVTRMDPVVAPTGTVTTIWVADADEICAGV